MDWQRNGSACFRDNGTYVAELLVPETLGFLRRMAGSARPFFLALPFHLIHGPNQVPQRFLDLYPEHNASVPARAFGMCGVCECARPEARGALGIHYQAKDATWGSCRTVLAMAAALDWAVGAIVDGLRTTGLWDNTLLVFTSDNGAQPGQGGTSYPLRGWKTQLYEGGIRVPAFVSGGSPLLPVHVRGSVNSKLYHVTDWLPTIVQLANASCAENQPLDGHNIWPSIVEATTPSPRDEILLNLNPACDMGFVTPNAGIRRGRWKLLVGCFNTTLLAPSPSSAVELYDLDADPYETTDRAQDEPDVVKHLLQRLAVFGMSTDQVPPTLFPPHNGTQEGANGHLSVAPWNYQCPQCPLGGAQPDAQGRRIFRPWCDSVEC